MEFKKLFLLVFVLAFGWGMLLAQDHGQAQKNSGTETEQHDEPGAEAGHDDHEGGEYDPVSTVMGHIADANQFHVWKGVHIPLPVFLYAPEHGWTTGLSSMFEHGHTAVDGYVLNHGRVNRIADHG